jgi:hypothetical protein
VLRGSRRQQKHGRAVCVCVGVTRIASLLISPAPRTRDRP